MSVEIKSKACEFLSEGRYMQFATVTQDSKPSLRTIAYVLENNKIYFLTDKTSDKFKEIEGNSNVACLISKDNDDLTKSLQLRVGGKAKLVTNEESINKIKVFLGEKYPSMKDLPPDPNMVFFSIELKTGVLLDNSKGFFHTDCFYF